MHSRIRINHMVGNANTGVVIGIRNTGGRNLRIKRLNLAITRDGKPLLQLPGLNYFESPTSQAAVLFVPFTMKPGESWTHSVSFFNEFDRQTEKLFRESESALTGDIRNKLRMRPENDKDMVVTDAHLVEPFQKLFDRLFVWQPGEYVISLAVSAEPGSASFTKKYRFTLYESDTRELSEYVNDYKYGIGLSFGQEKHSGVNVSLSEHVG